MSVREMIAEALAAAKVRIDQEFGGNAEIVTNDSGTFGTVWVTDPDTPGRFGITAMPVHTPSLRQSFVDFPSKADSFEERMRQAGVDADNPPERFAQLHAYVGEGALTEPAQANAHSPGAERGYAYHRMPDLDACVSFLRAYAAVPAPPAPRP